MQSSFTPSGSTPARRHRSGAGLGEELGLTPAADPLRHFGGVVGARGIAAAVAQEQVVEHLFLASRDRLRRLDLRPLIVTRGQVEADRAAAATAVVAVALAERSDSPGLLLAAEFPRGDIFRENRSTHGSRDSLGRLTKKLRWGRKLW